ncbi:nuclear receptor-interacting protein 1 [Dendrobates tinctorius]|uniref:nuclear receptor-interacting protein 1 n=1 Tax=Dendrobates tinctorius TaxID=92724 RepID=UPI003CCA5C47
MTHGEELSSEMQQDPIVLTYLEGLLMHQAAGGSITAVDKLSGRVKADDNFNISGNVFTNCKNNAPMHNSSQSSGMLHLKKARLLQSSEDWHAAKRRRLSDSINGNGKNESLLAGMVENVPKGKQDSTLLASLLQSFSSRLQSVALTQQIKQSLKDQGFALSQQGKLDEKDNQCYGLASNHLKTLLNKSRSKDNTVDSNLTGLAKSSVQEKFVEPSLSAQSSAKVVGESISCAARLQAVANMVEKRSSPTASPKPSVACSQLALLLSSEAHLQQYSREHALKAQSASQLASERLAAMARLKESSEKDLGRLHLSSNVPASLHNQARTVTNGLTNAGNISPFPNTLCVPNSPLKTVGYKNQLERTHGKPSPNNSLLLHLLKSQNGASVGKKLAHNEIYTAFEGSATPTTIDDCSDNNPSFTEEESSDDESTHSNCVPIDLSFKNRADRPKMLHSAGSIENLTESLLHNWDPKINEIEIGKGNKDLSTDSTLKPYQKVTLLQLLLGHKTEDVPSTIEDLQTSQKATDLSKFTFSSPGPLSESPRLHNTSPLNALSLHSSSKAESPMNLAHQPFPVKPPFTSFVNHIQPERVLNPASNHLIELTRNKGLQTTNPLANENTAQNAPFSASKLLQNLAHCGMPSSAPNEQVQSKSIGPANPKSLGLIERLNSPLVTNQPRTYEEGRGFSSPSTPVDSTFSGSEIENLLERRTVLQLLLATPNNKCKNEKVQKPIKDEVNIDRTERLPSEHVVAFRVKTEAEDNISAPDQEPSAPSPVVASLHKTARPAPEDVRSPHSSPHDFSLSKNGLLSRLLRQNHEVYDTGDLEVNNKLNNLESKQIDSKISCIVPKKRKMHHNDSVESQVKIAKMHSPEAGNLQFCTSPSLGEVPFLHEDKVNGTKTDHDNKNVPSQNSLNGNKKVSWSRESKGFNVLKQLLLSENCVRDSQHRNNMPVDELLRGNRSNSTGNSEFMLPSLNMFMGQHSHQNNLGQMSFQYPSPLKNSPHSSPDILRNNPSRTDSGHMNMCPPPSDKGPIKWVITDMDKTDFGKDSPRLTKTNPILYYMLQKGAQTAASQDLRDRTSWTESLLGQAAEMTFKRESAHSRGTNRIAFTTPPNIVNNSLYNSNSSKYGLLDMLTIKKEPE